jgi:hypothetical protein
MSTYILNEKNIAKKGSDSIKSKIIDAFGSSKNQTELMAKLKKMDEGKGGTKWGDPGYMERDVFNGLISVCLGAGPGMLAAANTPIGIMGIPIGILSLYLVGVVFHLNATNYDKFHLLEEYDKKIKRKKSALEAMEKKEKDPKAREQINAKIKEANKCIKAIDKERRKLLPKKKQDEIGDADLDGFDFDEDWFADDDFNIEESVILEAKKKEKLFPVFLVTSYTDTPLGKVIKKFTKSDYSHACISLDTSMEKMYTFNGDNGQFGGGLSVEKVSNYIKYNNDSDLRVSALFLKKKDFDKLKGRIDDFVANAKKTFYNFIGLLDVVFQNGCESAYNQYSMICSQFVDTTLKFVDVDLTNTPSNLVTPAQISKIDNPKVYLLFEGKARNYNSKKIDKKIHNLLSTRAVPIKEGSYIIVEPIFESKEFPVEMTKDGDLLIKKKRNLNYKEEHSKSKQLFKTYKKNGNIEAMEYEADKLWYMNILIMKEIESAKDNRDELVEMRSKILNEFTLYVNECTKLDPEYNFETHFQSSPFSDASIKITGTTLKGGFNLLKGILKIM